MGRLSNPPEPTETIIDQGLKDSRRPRKDVNRVVIRVLGVSATTFAKKRDGFQTRPAVVQRTLGAVDVDQVVAEYIAGRSLREIAAARGVHHRLRDTPGQALLVTHAGMVTLRAIGDPLYADAPPLPNGINTAGVFPDGKSVLARGP